MSKLLTWWIQGGNYGYPIHKCDIVSFWNSFAFVVVVIWIINMEKWWKVKATSPSCAMKPGDSVRGSTDWSEESCRKWRLLTETQRTQICSLLNHTIWSSNIQLSLKIVILTFFNLVCFYNEVLGLNVNGLRNRRKLMNEMIKGNIWGHFLFTLSFLSFLFRLRHCGIRWRFRRVPSFHFIVLQNVFDVTSFLYWIKCLAMQLTHVS